MFSTVTLFVDEGTRGSLDLTPVTGSYDKIEKTFYELASMRRTKPKSEKKNTDSPASQENQLFQNDCPPAHPVEVNSKVMDYIEQKHSQELKRVFGNGVEMRRGTGKKTKEYSVSFHSEHAVLAQFARQKFITLYQKVATEFLVKTFDCKPSLLKGLGHRFPELLISTNPNGPSVTVMGDYISLIRLEEFLMNGPASPSRDVGRTLQRASVKDPVPVTTSMTNSKKKEEEEETCPICMDTLTDTKTLPQCQHSFCKDCLKRAFDMKPACPICGVLYGELKGTQPEKGTMKVTRDKSHLPGYEKYGTIIIEYYIPNGIQGVSSLTVLTVLTAFKQS